MSEPATLTDIDGIKIIDADAHFTEPADLWSARVPQSMLGKVPVQRTANGRTDWFIDNELWASVGGNTVGRGGTKVLGTNILQPFDTIDPAAWSVPARLEHMDRVGIHAQIVYPNAVGFSSNHVFAIDDLDQRELVLRTYNDFYVDIQEESCGRLRPQAMLPIWDMDLTVVEMTRLIDRGISGFTLSDKPEMIGLPELVDPYFAPMWDLFNESGSVANFHIGSGARREDIEQARAAAAQNTSDSPDTNMDGGALGPRSSVNGVAPAFAALGRQRQSVVGSTQFFMTNLRIMANLCMSDLFDRYPQLKIVSAESGIGWIPFALELMEFQFRESVTNERERLAAKRTPTEYFRDHFYVMFWFETSAPQNLLDVIGPKHVMVETDFPHPTCLYPGALEHFAMVLADVDADTRRGVLRDNAAALYGIPV